VLGIGMETRGGTFPLRRIERLLAGFRSVHPIGPSTTMYCLLAIQAQEFTQWPKNCPGCFFPLLAAEQNAKPACADARGYSLLACSESISLPIGGLKGHLLADLSEVFPIASDQRGADISGPQSDKHIERQIPHLFWIVTSSGS
jgi:hypothetical protein